MTVLSSRRMFLAGTGATLLMPALPAVGQTAAQARQLVETVVADINQIIASGRSETQMIEDFRGVFSRYADVPVIARYAFGSDARRATPRQREQFTEAFTGYFSRKYGRRFREFIGGRIDVQGESAIPRGIQVETMANLRGRAPFRVDFHVSDASGKLLFFNLIIEGIDMLLSERTEMGSLIDQKRGDIDAAIAALEAS